MPGMVAAVEQPGNKLCIVKWTGNIGRVIPKVGIITYCGREGSPDTGVLQIPDSIIASPGRTVSSVQNPATQLACCTDCRDTVLSL